jgi:hypothetical protein
MDVSRFIHRHIQLTDTASAEEFTSPQSGRSKLKLPDRNISRHHSFLLGQLGKAENDLGRLKEQRKRAGIEKEVGITLTFQGEPDFDLKFESLDFRPAGIELLAVQKRDKTFYASVYVPEGKLKHFIKKIEKYGSEKTSRGKPKNQSLVESISGIRSAGLKALWTDESGLFPQKGEEIWWEVWLRAEKGSDEIVDFFRANAPLIGLRMSDEVIRFPERTVLLAYGSTELMKQSLDLLNCIAELRKAKDTPDVFMRMTLAEQREWADDLLERIEPAFSDKVSLCLLDTGVSRDHPLIKPHLSENDMHTYAPGWISSDRIGHGTTMAGLALHGDLVDLLADNRKVHIPYRLESVKILPDHGANDPKLYGDITSTSISRAEIEAPGRQRIISMAITAPDNRDRGQPSSWSAKIDSICSGAEDDKRRLMIISAGNTNLAERHNYPYNNITESVHDPAQAWNALCVGAYTGKGIIDPKEYPGWFPIAPNGDLSPSSTTSMAWDKQWPHKPEIVFEGGNNALDPSTGLADTGPDSLRLLTTHHRPNERLFTLSGDTSAAASQAARMAAIIQAEYPGLWPEALRALIVHSARWTSAMKNRWEPLHKRQSRESLIRYCGFGVPNLTRALRSAGNELTLIIQDKLLVYEKKESRCVTRDMHTHAIPWPVEILEDMGNTDVEMRVTLSYFVEPNPARRGWSKRYGYPSYQLRFDVKTPTETLDQFKKRINRAAREGKTEGETTSDSSEWELGPNLRHKGSIHSDCWRGTAINLAQKGYIGIYPASGWWKERHQLGKWDRPVRYALIVSISTPGTDIDLYTPVANKVGIEIDTVS